MLRYTHLSFAHTHTCAGGAYGGEKLVHTCLCIYAYCLYIRVCRMPLTHTRACRMPLTPYASDAYTRMPSRTHTPCRMPLTHIRVCRMPLTHTSRTHTCAGGEYGAEAADRTAGTSALNCLFKSCARYCFFTSPLRAVSATASL